MKTRSSSEMIGGVTMEYLENSYQVKDYQMITKHLREKVHLEKQQGRRVKRGRIGTATSLQHRGLHNYPMQYNREDIRSAKWSPENRRHMDHRANIAKADSQALKQHCKDMFDFAVKNAPPKTDKTDRSAITNDRRTNKKPRVKSECILRQERTGPTRDGSVLYNNRARVLNSIRIRPYTDTDCRYNHERSSSQQSIRETMSQKSSMYQLLDLNYHKQRIGSSASCGSGSLLFVPRSQGSEYSEVFDLTTNPRPSTVTDFLSEMGVSDVPRYSVDSLGDWHDREDGHESWTNHQHYHQLLPPETPCSMNLVTLDEESCSESGSEVEVPEAPKVEQPPPPATKKGKTTAPEVISEPTPPPKLILKGPHCWVDDVTVTSSHPDSEEIENLETPAADTQTKQTSAQLDKPVTDNKDKTLTHSILKKTNGVKTTAENPIDTKCINEVKVEAETELKQAISKLDNVEISKLDKEEESESIDYNLPTFICPSSERKSREAAIKDWLYSSHNLFLHPRAVPML